MKKQVDEFFKIPTALMLDSNYNRTDLLVYGAIQRNFEVYHRKSYLEADIASDTGLHISCVKRAIKKLRGRWLQIKSKRQLDGYDYNVYTPLKTPELSIASDTKICPELSIAGDTLQEERLPALPTASLTPNITATSAFSDRIINLLTEASRSNALPREKQDECGTPEFVFENKQVEIATLCDEDWIDDIKPNVIEETKMRELDCDKLEKLANSIDETPIEKFAAELDEFWVKLPHTRHSPLDEIVKSIRAHCSGYKCFLQDMRYEFENKMQFILLHPKFWLNDKDSKEPIRQTFNTEFLIYKWNKILLEGDAGYGGYAPKFNIYDEVLSYRQRCRVDVIKLQHGIYSLNLTNLQTGEKYQDVEELYCKPATPENMEALQKLIEHEKREEEEGYWDLWKPTKIDDQVAAHAAESNLNAQKGVKTNMREINARLNKQQRDFINNKDVFK